MKTHTTTENAEAPAELALSDWFDGDEWCLERKDNPDIALCGKAVGGEWVPESETPEEIICPDCLRIRKGPGGHLL